MKTKNTIWSLALATLFVACDKPGNSTEDPSQGLTNEAYVGMVVSSGSYGSATKGIGHGTVTGDKAAVNFADAYIAGNGGEAGDPTVGNGEILAEEFGFEFKDDAGDYKAAKLFPAGTSSITLQFNYDNTTLTSNVNTRQGDVEDAVVMVSGTGNVTPGSDDDFTELEGNHVAHIEVTPEMSRLQILDDLTAGFTLAAGSRYELYKNLTIEAFYINRSKMDRTDAATNRTPATLADWAAAFAAKPATKYGLYTAGSWPITDASTIVTSNVTDAATHFFSKTAVGTTVGVDTKGTEVVGFNLFPQGVAKTSRDDAAAEQPHLVVRIGYTHRAKIVQDPVDKKYYLAVDAAGDIIYETVDYVNKGTVDAAGDPADDGDDTNNYSYVNFVAFNTGVGAYPAFEKANVYELKLSDIINTILIAPGNEGTGTGGGTNPPVKPTDPTNPDPDELAVEITIAVKSWTVVPVTPEL